MIVDPYHRVVKLLPKLAALSDKHRLKVLSEIDRVFAASGMTWEDIAAALEPPASQHGAAELRETIDKIRAHPQILTSNAKMFLSELNAQIIRLGEAGGVVHLSSRQAAWLVALQDKAEAESAKQPQRPALHVVST